MTTKKHEKIILEQLLQDLEDLESFLKDLWQFLPLPTCYVNPLLIILDVNSALEEFFGFQAMELIGKKAETLFSDKSLAKEIFQDLSRKKKPIRKEGEFLTKGKEKKEVVVSGTLRQDAQNNILGYYLAFSDISKLKESQKNLEKKVQQRTKELQERVEQLERFQKITIGRELKMAQLKKEIQRLKKDIKNTGKEPKTEDNNISR